MTKQDYELIARVLREGSAFGAAHFKPRDVAIRFADALAADNPRFNRATFLRACGA